MNDIISPNDINIAQDELFKTIELLCKQYMKDMNKADETIECKIIDASNATNHIYTVITSNNVKLDVQSENTEYKVDDKVQVLIPQGNYNAVKRIIGKCYAKQDYDKQLNTETFIPIWTYKTSSYSKNLYIINALKPKLFVNCAFIEEIVQNNDDSSWTINGDFYVSGEYLRNQYYHGILRAEIYQDESYKDLLNDTPEEGRAYHMNNITFEGFPYFRIDGIDLDSIASTNMVNLSYLISELNGNNVMQNSSSLLRLKSETQEWSGTNTFNMFGNGLQENKLYCDNFSCPLDMWKSFEYCIFFPNISIKMIDQDESPDNVLRIYIDNSFMVLGQQSSATLALYSKGKHFEYYNSYNKNLLADPYFNKLRIWLCNTSYKTNMENYVSGKILQYEHLNSPLFENKISLYNDIDIPTYELYDAWIRKQDFWTTVIKDMVTENQLIIYPNSHNSTVINNEPYFGIRMYLDPNAILESKKNYVIQGNITHQYDDNTVGIMVRYGEGDGNFISTFNDKIDCHTQPNNNTLLANNFFKAFTNNTRALQNVYIDLFFPFPFGFVCTYDKGTQFTLKEGDNKYWCKLDAALQTVVSIVAYNESDSTENKAIFYAVEMMKNLKLSYTDTNGQHQELPVDMTLFHRIDMNNGAQVEMFTYKGYVSDTAKKVANKTSSGGYYVTFQQNNPPVINDDARLKCIQACLQNHEILSHVGLSKEQLIPESPQGGGGAMDYESYNFPITLQEFSVMNKDDMIFINIATGKKLNLHSTSGLYDYGQDPPQHYLEWNFISGISGSGETFFPKRGVDAYELQNVFMPQWRDGFDDNHTSRAFRVKLYENGSIIEQQTITLKNLGERSAE